MQGMQDPSAVGESASEQNPEKCPEECLELQTPLHLSRLGRFLGPLTAIPELQSPPEEEQPDSTAAEGELPDKEQQPELAAPFEQSKEDALQPIRQQAIRDSPERRSGTISRLSANSEPWFPPPRKAANTVNVWAPFSNVQLSSGPLGLGTPFAGWVPSLLPRAEMHSTWQACSEFGQPGNSVPGHASHGQPAHPCGPQIGCDPQPAYLLPLLPGQQWPPYAVLPFRNPFSLSPPLSNSVQPGYHSLGMHLPASGRMNLGSYSQGYQQHPLPPTHVLPEQSAGLPFQPDGAASLQPDAPHPAATMRRRRSAVAASRKLYATATTQASHEKNLQKIESLCHVLNSQARPRCPASSYAAGYEQLLYC